MTGNLPDVVSGSGSALAVTIPDQRQQHAVHHGNGTPVSWRMKTADDAHPLEESDNVVLTFSMENDMAQSRRRFLQDVSNGMLLAGLGTSLAGDLGISTAVADEGDTALSFGEMQPLVELLQDTPPNKLQPKLVRKLKTGEADLRSLIAAAALANAETFGGQDYVGFHTEMALIPALQMASELSADRQALPVLKVLYRNTERIQTGGFSKRRTLKRIPLGNETDSANVGEQLRAASRAGDIDRAEQIFAASANRSLEDAFNGMLWAIQDNANVHRFAIAHRAWALIDVVGEQHAHTILRQCVRFCAHNEAPIQRYFSKRNLPTDPMRPLIPKLLNQYRLLEKPSGTRTADDAWLEKMSRFIYEHNNADSMDAVAAALADGIHPESIGQAISLAANQLVLRQDRLNDKSWRSHGATPGVHASDANNAWRNMVRHANDRNVVVGLMVSAYHTGGSKCYRDYEALPHDEHLVDIKSRSQKALLASAEDAIKANDQTRAAAAIAVYGQEGYGVRPVFDLMLRYAVSEDGRLHAEKYYRTVAEEFATTSAKFRWRQIIGLARVTASAYGFDANDNKGFRAPGYDEACRLLNVQA